MIKKSVDSHRSTYKLVFDLAFGAILHFGIFIQDFYRFYQHFIWMNFSMANMWYKEIISTEFFIRLLCLFLVFANHLETKCQHCLLCLVSLCCFSFSCLLPKLFPEKPCARQNLQTWSLQNWQIKSVYWFNKIKWLHKNPRYRSR